MNSAAPVSSGSVPLLSECQFPSPGGNATTFPKLYQEHVGNRMKIVAGLGGEASVKAIRTIKYPYIDADKKASSDYMNELERTKFESGESIVQTEDGVGRKAIVLLLVHKDDPTHQAVETIFQRCPETMVAHPSQRMIGLDGRSWLSKVLDPYSSSTLNVDVIKDALTQLREGNHPKYLLVKA
ncbi:MAG TPA: hypothetical protein VLE89_08765 [Chlamydiales bacterium]|nr:hypothetical protein [Chlamydiales bacterium]